MVEKIVFLDRGSIGEAVELTRPGFKHEWVAYSQTAAADLHERIADATCIVTNKVPVDAAAMAAAPRLRHIAIAATGYDKIDLNAARSLNIEVSNVRGYATASVPEHTFALILALRRALPGYMGEVAAGSWARAEQFCLHSFPITDLKGTRLVVVGRGALGSRVGAIGEAFGMDVVFAGRKGQKPAEGQMAFSEAIETADVLTLHCPLTPESRDLIGAAELDAMKREAVIVNTARGGLIDEHALAGALKSGAIAGAALDVLSAEPPAGGNVLLDLLGKANLILTPHVAWAGGDAMRELWRQVVANLEASYAGAPKNLATK